MKEMASQYFLNAALLPSDYVIYLPLLKLEVWSVQAGKKVQYVAETVSPLGHLHAGQNSSADSLEVRVGGLNFCGLEA